MAEERVKLTAETSLLVPHGLSATSNNPSCMGSGDPDPSAFCVMIAVGGLPVGSTIDNVKLFAREAGAVNWVACTRGNDCLQGWCRFVGNYQIQTSYQGITVRQQFRNWSDRLDREARVVVEYSFPKKMPVIKMKKED
mgnify:FL=1